MRIFINSDLVWYGQLLDVLPNGLRQLLEVAHRDGHEIVLPLTSFLELERHQEALRLKRVAELKEALATLGRYSVEHGQVDPEALVTRKDLPLVAQASGFQLTVAPPLWDDYQEAHVRACGHHPPHPLDSKSDEMRDLIIWSQARRAAREDGQAMLLSRDHVHSGQLGDEEASADGLVRFKSFDEALDYLEETTPARQVFQDLLSPVWQTLIDHGLSATSPLELLHVKGSRFRQGELGLAYAEATIEFQGPSGPTRRQARITLDGRGKQVTTFESLHTDEIGQDEVIEVTTPSTGATEQTDADLAALREALGE